MMEVGNVMGGISSLGGFAFQIRVFLYYLLNLDENEMIEFEAIDDINVSKIESLNIDKYEISFISKIKKIDISHHAIQVKRTNIDTSTARKILFNWLLIEIENINVERYTLLTSDLTVKDTIISNLDKHDIYIFLKNSKKKKSSNEAKLKFFFGAKFDEFETYFDSVVDKHEIVRLDNVNEIIDQNCKYLFKKSGVDISVYNLRVSQLLNYITCEILNSIHDKRSFAITYAKFMQEAENISNNATDERISLSYSEFKRNHSIDLNELAIAKSREYQQLLHCEMPKALLTDFLTKRLYYGQYRALNIECNTIQPINDIEVTTHENFVLATEQLKYDGNDTPRQRLNNTINLENSYAENVQIRHGVCVHMTKDAKKQDQISWKDE
ncbi:hypothetical protein [Carnobacterium divergens]